MTISALQQNSLQWYGHVLRKDRTMDVKTVCACMRLVWCEQVAAVMLATVCLAVEHGLFNRIRQVALICTLHLTVVPLVQASQCAKRYLDWFSRFCSVYGRGQRAERSRYVETFVAVAHI